MYPRTLDEFAKGKTRREHTPAWAAWAIVILLSIVGFFAAWGWNRATDAAKKTDVLEERETNHQQQNERQFNGLVEWMKKNDARGEKFNDKLDKVLDEVRRKP